MRQVRKGAWQEHYDGVRGFCPLGDAKRALLAEHVLAPEGFEEALRFEADGLAVLVLALRGADGSFTAVEKGRPNPQAVAGAAAVVTDTAGRVLLCRSTKGMVGRVGTTRSCSRTSAGSGAVW